MKAALVLCPQWNTEYPVVSLALLAAQLRRRGHEVDVYDVNKEMSQLCAGPDIKEFQRLPSLNPVWTDPAYWEEQVIPAYKGYLDAVAGRILSRGARLVGFSIYFCNG